MKKGKRYQEAAKLVDAAKAYLKAKSDSCMHEMIDELRGVLYDYDSIDVE